MRSALFLGLITLAPLAHAQDEKLEFHNILITSRSIISPSQYYQVKDGTMIEAEAGFTDGRSESNSPASRKDLNLRGGNYGLAGFLALNPMVVLGVNIKDEHLNVEDVTRARSTRVSPSVTYSPIAELSFGLAAHIVRGHAKDNNVPSENSNYSTYTLGMTAHQEMWEATAMFSSENKDDETSINNQPQTLGLHGRYRIVDPITLGVSFLQKDYSAFDNNLGDLKDATELGIHLESAMSEAFSIEIDYTNLTDIDGSKDIDGSEFTLLGQALLTSTLEVGAKLSYRSLKSDLQDFNAVSPGFFVAAKF